MPYIGMALGLLCGTLIALGLVGEAPWPCVPAGVLALGGWYAVTRLGPDRWFL
jgi:hypothetical protein